MQTQIVYLSLFTWPLLGAALFFYLPLRVAILTTFLAGWLFLPMATIRFEGVPNFDKATAIALGILLGLTLCRELGRMRDVRLHWLDLPMAVWLVLPMASSLSVGLGAYDGASGVLENIILWGLPYWIGRAFFNTPAALRTLATSIVVAGVVYVPLCLYEARFSPQLHNLVYGFHQHDFRQALRGGGYRPMVFMTHGLMVAMFMATATLMAIGLWYSGARQRLLNLPMGFWVSVLLITTLMSRSAGAVGLLVIGGAVLLASDRYRLAMPLIMLALIPPIYVFSRIGQTEWPHRLIAVSEVIAGPERADSLSFRIYNEEALMQRAFEAPLFGWRGWNLARQTEPHLPVEQLPVAESMWILAFGQHGLVGLTAFLALMVVAPILLFRRVPKPLLGHPVGAIVACMGLATILYAIDSMFNAMLNPIFMIILGTVTSLLLRVPQARAAASTQPSAAFAAQHNEAIPNLETSQ